MLYARSIVGFGFLVAYVAVVGPPALGWALLTGRVGHLFRLGIVGASLTRRLLGIELSVSGLAHVDQARATVYCINHRSNVDAVIFEALYPRCPRLLVLHKAEMSRLPILGRAMRLAGFVPVNRADRGQAAAAVDLAVERLRRGSSFLVAPEGTRSLTGDLQPFKKGGFVMAIKAQAPVVPVAIVGAADAMPKGQVHVRPARVSVLVGAPVSTSGLTLEDRDALAAEVRSRIADLIRELHERHHRRA